jgi:hypothetical protein
MKAKKRRREKEITMLLIHSRNLKVNQTGCCSRENNHKIETSPGSIKFFHDTGKHHDLTLKWEPPLCRPTQWHLTLARKSRIREPSTPIHNGNPNPLHILLGTLGAQRDQFNCRHEATYDAHYDLWAATFLSQNTRHLNSTSAALFTCFGASSA